MPYNEAKEFLLGVSLQPLRFFCPTGKQEEYIQKVANSIKESNVPIVLFAAANGVGKTNTNVNIALNCIYRTQSGWLDYPLFNKFPFPKLCWYCSTESALKDKIIPFFQKYSIPGTFTENKGGKTYIAEIIYPELGWSISFKTYDQDADKYESADVGLLIFDEPAPESIWMAGKSRRRLGCLTLLGLTPMFTAPYLHDEVKVLADNDKRGYKYLEADLYSACKSRGVRGYLEPDIIDDMADDCMRKSPDLYNARILGKFAYYSQLVYTLDWSKHFVNPDDYPIPQYSLIKQIVDPHDSRPPACIFAALCPNGRVIIFAETPTDKNLAYWDMRIATTIRDDIRTWVSVQSKFRFIFENCSIIRIMDRRFGWQTRMKKNFAESYWQESRNLGMEFDFEKSYDYAGGELAETEWGHQQVRQTLLPLSDGKPGLVIWNTCYHTWNGLTHYIRKPDATKQAADKAAQSGKLVEKYKDFPDCVRYLVCDDSQTSVPPPPKTRYEKEMEKVYRRTNENERSELYD